MIEHPNDRNWCGSKGEPPYFYQQFWRGAVATGLLLGYVLFFRKRR